MQLQIQLQLLDTSQDCVISINIEHHTFSTKVRNILLAVDVERAKRGLSFRVMIVKIDCIIRINF